MAMVTDDDCGSGLISAGPRSRGSRSQTMGVKLARLRVATPRQDYAKTIDAIVSVVAIARARRGAAGHRRDRHPGHALAAHRARQERQLHLVERSAALQQTCERALDRDVRFANDANCFALSEATDGAAAGAEVVFGVILGTGCGGGIAVNGRVLTGANGDCRRVGAQSAAGATGR